MNKCLLSKWIIKLERGDTDLCTKMLRNKYLKEKGFFSSNVRWGALSSGKGCMRLSLFVIVGSNMWLAMGRNLGFGMKFGWESVIWKSSLINCLWYVINEVARVLEGGNINLSFRRNFGREEVVEWEESERELAQVFLSDREDFIRWALSANDQFSTSSLYRHCSALFLVW
jgi:hypothetical protein